MEFSQWSRINDIMEEICNDLTEKMKKENDYFFNLPDWAFIRVRKSRRRFNALVRDHDQMLKAWSDHIHLTPLDPRSIPEFSEVGPCTN